MSVRINLEIGHEAAIRTKRTLEGFTHDWEVFVRGCDGAEIHHYIEKVVFHLHETFPKPKRVIKEPPYSVKESGYAGFNFPIDIYLKNLKDEPKKIKFNYDLHLQQTGPAIKKVQQEKYIFNNPSEDFKQKLLRGGGVIVSSSSTQDSLDLKSSIEEKNQLLNKPKLGGSDMAKKHKVKPEEHKGSGLFTDLFGPPIQKTSKISPDSKAKEPKDVNKSSTSTNKEKEKGSEKEKIKNKSPVKDKDKDRDRDRLKEKVDSDRKIKDKEKSKDRNKERDRSKEKSSKRDKSPRPKSSSPKRVASPKRPPSPKMHQSPVPKIEEKRTESSKDKKSDDLKTDKKYKKEKRDKDKEKEYSDKYKDSNKNDYKEHKKDLKPKEVPREKEPSPLPPPKIDKKEKPKEIPKEPPKEIPEIPPEKVKDKSEEKKEKHKHKKKDKEKRDKKDKEDRDKSHKSDKKSEKNNTKYEPPKPVEVDKSSLFSAVKQHEPEPKPQPKPAKPLNALFSEIENDNSNSSISSKEEPAYVEPLPPPPPPPPVKPETKTESLFEPKIEPEKVKPKKEKNKKKDKKSDKEEKKKKRKLEAKPEEEPETKIFKEDTYSDGEQTTTSQSKDLDKENQENPEEYMRILRELQHKIMTLQDNTELQKVVQLIAETGRYEVSARTFDFDLCLLERSTVRRLQEFFSISS